MVLDNNLFSLPPESVISKRILYTPSSFARISLIHLQETGILHALTPHESRRSNLISYLFIVVKSGCGQLWYDGKQYSLISGDCVFIDCRKTYCHSPDANNLWELLWCHFYGPNMNLIYSKYIERGGQPVFHPINLVKYYSLIKEVFYIASSGDYIRDMRINEKLNSLLTLLMKDSWCPEFVHEKKKRVDVQSIKEYIDNHYNCHITLDELSSKFFINKTYLSKVFKEQYGLPVNAYLLQYRVTQSKLYLRFTDKSIEQIGFEVGIADANYFSRVFKKIEGITPGAYRKMWMNKQR